MSELKLSAYYYGFEHTGCTAIDEVLAAVASAGDGCHLTEDWRDIHSGDKTPEQEIQDAANNSAKTIAAMQKRIDELEREASNLDYEYPRDIFHEIRRVSLYAFYLFQWVPYQTDARQWRLKMCHDVKHKDGRVEYGVWPNGSSCGSFKDDDVEFIRISRDQHGRKYIDPRDKEEKS